MKISEDIFFSFPFYTIKMAFEHASCSALNEESDFYDEEAFEGNNLAEFPVAGGANSDQNTPSATKGTFEDVYIKPMTSRMYQLRLEEKVSLKNEETNKQHLNRKASQDDGSKQAKHSAESDENNRLESDMEDERYEKEKKNFMEKLKKTRSEIRKIAKETKDQASSREWFKHRKGRLTASNFGRICRMKPKTSCTNTVNDILHKPFTGNRHTKFGKDNEHKAIEALETELGLQVIPCGLFIDEELPFLGASPDGLIREDGIVEIKCSSAANDKKFTPEEGIKQKIIKSCNYINDKLELKRIHPYYYQVQGQLHITKRKYCYFVIWTPKGMLYEKIERDETFWESEMVGKLTEFYMECMLPEIIDSRYKRGLPMRERKSYNECTHVSCLNTLITSTIYVTCCIA